MRCSPIAGTSNCEKQVGVLESVKDCTHALSWGCRRGWFSWDNVCGAEPCSLQSECSVKVSCLSPRVVEVLEGLPPLWMRLGDTPLHHPSLGVKQSRREALQANLGRQGVRVLGGNMVGLLGKGLPGNVREGDVDFSCHVFLP